jgi:transcriptional antiterminator Rof (Rho-off)
MISGRCKFLKEWPEWDSSVHGDDAQIERQGRAMTYKFTYDVNGLTETARFSSTSDLPYYDTSLSQCTCHDFQDRHLPCKHMYRLAVELGVVEIVRRPSGGGSAASKKLLEEVKASENIDSHPEQIKRMEKARGAKMAPLSIDYASKTAIFPGSGKTPYETTVDTCTCRDYVVRRLPCKHIYRLRMELEKAE